MDDKQWDALFNALENWRLSLSRGEPSVTLVAEKYAHSPWAVLASTLLSLRTKDAVTLARSEVLLASCPSPSAALQKSAEEIERLIYPVGFYKTKAARLLEIAQILMDKYGGEVPSTMDELLALPGVGRKTANLVLIEAFDKEGLCVDTHVHRISNRAGFVSTKTPDETEAALRLGMPQKYWKGINALLVLYGQRVCMPRRPLCANCVMTAYCKMIKG